MLISYACPQCAILSRFGMKVNKEKSQSFRDGLDPALHHMMDAISSNWMSLHHIWRGSGNSFASPN